MLTYQSSTVSGRKSRGEWDESLSISCFRLDILVFVNLKNQMQSRFRSSIRCATTCGFTHSKFSKIVQSDLLVLCIAAAPFGKASFDSVRA